MASDFPELPPTRSEVASATSAVSPYFPNHGNTCYVAVVLQLLLQLMSLSVSLLPAALQHAPLRRVLSCPDLANWRSFLRELGLGGPQARPEDAALFLESMVEPEPALQAQLQLVEELSVECVGCRESRVLRSAELVHRVTAPTEPTDLQTLLQTDFESMDDEREVSCPQCFASTAVPQACSYQPTARPYAYKFVAEV